MYYADKIKMKKFCYNSNNLLEIDEIHIQNDKWYKKENIHDHLKNYPGSIKVYISPYPILLAKKSIYDEKYVASEPNNTRRDNLLELPREYQ